MILAKSRLGVALLMILHLTFVASSPLSPLLPRTSSHLSLDSSGSIPPKYIGKYVALGDSFASGPGAGEPYNGTDGAVTSYSYGPDCEQYTNAYPNALKTDPSFIGVNDPWKFAACAGSNISSVRKYQTQFVDSKTNLLTISVGGNDIQLGPALSACVFGLQSDSSGGTRSCDDRLNRSGEILYSPQLAQDWFNMTHSLVTRSSWLPNKPTLYYQLGYPSFFESYTTQCDNTSFSPADTGGPPLSQALRAQLNHFQQEYNYLISYWIAHLNAEVGGSYLDGLTSSFGQYIDLDLDFSGHRFCREGVTEPDRSNPETWFFNFVSSQKPPDMSAYLAIDPAQCEAQQTGEIGDALTCALASAARDPAFQPQNLDLSDTDNSYVLHPTSIGHSAIRDELLNQLDYSARAANASYRNYKVMAVGDSITYGYRSTSGYGYRKKFETAIYDAALPGKLEWIGTQISGDIDNVTHTERCEGYSGNKTDDLRDRIMGHGILAQNPNLILLMSGTNDMNSGNITFNDPIPAAARLGDFVDDLLRAVPDVTILLAQMPMIGNNLDPTVGMNDIQRRVVQYNAAIASMVNTKVAQGRKIIKVTNSVSTRDHYTGDDLHPDDTGYDKLGDDFVAGLYQANLRDWIAARDIES